MPVRRQNLEANGDGDKKQEPIHCRWSFPASGLTRSLGLAVVLGETVVARRLEIDQRAEDAALQAPAGQRSEKSFHRNGPGARSRGEVEGPSSCCGIGDFGSAPGEPGSIVILIVKPQPASAPGL